MTLTLKARLRDRIRQLPEVADHDCDGLFAIFVRSSVGLVCRTCGRP